MPLDHAPRNRGKGADATRKAKASFSNTRTRETREGHFFTVPAIAPDDHLDFETVRARLLKAGQAVTRVYKDKNLVVAEFPNGDIKKRPYRTPKEPEKAL